VADFSGAVLVAHRGEVIFRGAYGYADAEAKVPNTPETRFQLASVSKAFAAMSIMILEERGVLSVQDPLCLYLTGCPPAWAGVRLHHLLTHTSGLPGDDIQVDLTFADLSYESAFALVRDRPLLFEPGSAYGYSNVGYIALGAVIERASGVGYAEFVRENIFTPLGISRSGAVGDGMALGTEAVGYNEPGVRTRYVVHPLIYAAGGLVSTVDDLFLWDRALYGETLIKRETLRRIFTPNMSDYGYGWAIERSAYGPRIGHSGNIEGFRTRIARYPDTQSTIIILSNYNRADVEGMVSEIESLLHK
jgi:CubicO group peptidase (beta-lactamase class C family)